MLGIIIIRIIPNLIKTEEYITYQVVYIQQPHQADAVLCCGKGN